MATIKKSAMQIKRGFKPNLPLLKEGQLGWCKDTKELFIGDGGKNELVNKKQESSGGGSTGTVTAEYLKLVAPNGREFKVTVSNTGELAVNRFIPEIESEYSGLLINQIYGGGIIEDNGTAITHGFIELYNSTKADISLEGLSVQYSLTGTDWKVCELHGSIKAKHSYLIRANRHSLDSSASVKYVVSQCDRDWPITMYNKGIKVCLIKGIDPLEVANPFRANNGAPVAGYIDMIGAADSEIDGSEGMYAAGQSKQKSVRRKVGFIDTQDNELDCDIVDYRTADIEKVRPRYSGDGAWDENGAVIPDERLLDYLKINQVYGGGSDAACSHHFVELYNTHKTKAISLRDVSLFGATYKAPTWQHVKLTGSIPPRHSFLLRGVSGTGAYKVEIANFDQECTLKLDKAMKVFLIETSDPNNLNGIVNPHNVDGAWKKHEGYIDGFGCHGNSGLMLNGALTDTIDGFETEAPGGGDPGTNIVGCGGNSKQTSMRRKAGFIDTDTNSEDFEALRYANFGIDHTLTDKQPRWVAYGTWEPGDIFGGESSVNVYSVTNSFGTDPKTTRNIHWFTDDSIETFVECGEFGQIMSKHTATTIADGTEKANTVKLTGLKPGTKYSYRIGHGTEFTKVDEFTTESDTNTDVEFIHVTDTQSATKEGFDIFANALRDGLKDSPVDFIAHTGDVIEDQGDEKNRWKMFFESAKEEFANNALMVAPGNNDMLNANLDLFSSHFAFDNVCPACETSYFFEYGNTLFITLDSNRRLTEQKPWLEQILSTHEKKWKVILIHAAPYTSIKETTMLFAEVFEAHSVDLVLCGHKHMYMRSHKIKNDVKDQEGVMYVMGNGCGPKQGSLDPAMPWMNVAIAPGIPTYNKVKITEEEITLTCYKFDGTNSDIIDRVTLTKDGGVIEPPVEEIGDFIVTSDGDKLITSTNENIIWN